MSIIQTLTEGIVNRDLKKEGQALLSKWKLLDFEGLDIQQSRHNIAFENQAKELFANLTQCQMDRLKVLQLLHSQSFVAFCWIDRKRSCFRSANVSSKWIDLLILLPQELVMIMLKMLDLLLILVLEMMFQNQFMARNQVGSQVTGGVDLVGSLGENIGGLRQQAGYAYASRQVLICCI